MIDMLKIQSAILRGERCAAVPQLRKHARKRRVAQIPLDFAASIPPDTLDSARRKLAASYITPRGLQILQGLASGQTNTEIAASLATTESEVRQFIRLIYLQTDLTAKCRTKRTLLGWAFLELSSEMPVLQA